MSYKGLVDLVSMGQSPETRFPLQEVWQKGSPMHIVLPLGPHLSSPALDSFFCLHFMSHCLFLK